MINDSFTAESSTLLDTKQPQGFDPVVYYSMYTNRYRKTTDSMVSPTSTKPAGSTITVQLLQRRHNNEATEVFFSVIDGKGKNVISDGYARLK